MPEQDPKIPVADPKPDGRQPGLKRMIRAIRIGALRTRLLIAFVAITALQVSRAAVKIGVETDESTSTVDAPDGRDADQEAAV